MERSFSACEIVELGVQIEENGRDFYRGLAETLPPGPAVEVFKELAEEEDKHIAVFRDLSSGRCSYEPEGAYPEEFFAYMNALAGQYVFNEKTTGAELAKKVKTCEDAFDIGINMEKDNIVFYEDMKKLVPVKDRDLIDKVIAEEKKHLKLLLQSKKGCVI